MNLEQSRMFEKSTAQIVMTSNIAGNLANLLCNRVEIFCPETREVSTRNICPVIFNRIKFRRIRRQIFGYQPRFLFHNIPLSHSTSMSRQPVPKQYYFFSEMLSQIAYKYFNLSAFNGAGQETHKEANSFPKSKIGRAHV